MADAIKDGGRDIQATVDDWTAEYQADEDSRGQALADLVNCFLRVSRTACVLETQLTYKIWQCCACNLTVNLHEAQDIDGITEKLEDIQNEFAKVRGHLLSPMRVLTRARRSIKHHTP